MEGLFCANFYESRKGLQICQNVSHAECYKGLGVEKFPMSRMEDTSGNIWFKQEKHEDRLNHAVRRAHAVIPFQCEDCWMLNLEGRLPVAGLDDMFIMLIR